MTVDLTQERRSWAEGVLRGAHSRISALPHDEQIVFAVALLVADPDGSFDVATVADALGDPSVAQAAATLLERSGYGRRVTAWALDS